MSSDPKAATDLLIDAYNERDQLFVELVRSMTSLKELFRAHACNYDEDTFDTYFGHLGMCGEVGNGLSSPLAVFGRMAFNSAPEEQSKIVDAFIEVCRSPSQLARISKFKKNQDDIIASQGETKITALYRCHDRLSEWVAAQDYLDETVRQEFKKELDIFNAEARKIEDIVVSIEDAHAKAIAITSDQLRSPFFPPTKEAAHKPF